MPKNKKKEKKNKKKSSRDFQGSGWEGRWGLRHASSMHARMASAGGLRLGSMGWAGTNERGREGHQLAGWLEASIFLASGLLLPSLVQH